MDLIAKVVLQAVDYLGMIELNVSRYEFCWSNRRDGGKIYSKIYRGVANADWWALFPDASLNFMPETTSNHKPLLL